MMRKLKKQIKDSKKTASEVALTELNKLGKQAGGLINDLKKKYDKFDDKTKKKIIAGLVATVAILSSAHAVKRIVKRKKKK